MNIDERCYGHEPAMTQLKNLRAAETANATLFRETKRMAELEAAARKVVWFDYCDDDEDVQEAVADLRKLLEGER